MKTIKKIIPWVILSICVIYYFFVVEPQIKGLENENKIRKHQADSARAEAKIFEARADSLEAVKQEVRFEIKEIQQKTTRDHEKFKRDINRFVILVDADSLLLTGKAISDSINRIGFSGSDPY